MTTATVTSYREALQAAGYPLDCVVIDYETYFNGDYSLSKMSTIEYVTDKRFECLGVSVTNHGITTWHVDHEAAIEDLQEEYGDNLERCTVLAHNSRFDLTILLHIHGLIPVYHIDTVGVARSVHPQFSAKLKDLAAFYGLKPKGETASFKGATRRFRTVRQGGRGKNKDEMIVLPRMTEETERKLARYANHDAELAWEIFQRMLPRFSRPELELRVQQHTIEQFLDAVLVVDVQRAERIRRDMLHEVTKACEATGHPVKDISGNHSFRRILAAALAEIGEEVPLKESQAPGKVKLIPCFAKTDSECQRLLEHDHLPVALLMKARVAIRAWPSKAKRVHNIIKQANANDGKLCVPLHYCGAHTGRWSGGEAINLQNLGARGHPLDAEVRNVLLPPDNHVLIVCDQAAVEARGTAWLAGQDDLLDVFRTGRDVYCEFASNIFPFSVRKPRRNDPAPVARKLKAARACGKVGVLGGGYGMGPLKCQTYGSGFGLSLTFADATEIINTYRTTYPAIVKFWRDIYAGFLWTHRTGRESVVGPIHIYRDTYPESVDVVMVLPSGRELRYANVGEQQGDRGPELICYSPKKKTWSKIYGGYLTENLVQAICRDTLAETILALEAEGIRVPLTVHDEVVCVVPKEDAERAMERVLCVMRTSPTWAPDLPLDAEATVMDCYGK